MAQEKAEKEQQKYSDSLDKKYFVTGKLHPTIVDFGRNYDHVTMDLRKVQAEIVDDFCKKYPKQPYFKLKNAKEDKAPGK